MSNAALKTTILLAALTGLLLLVGNLIGGQTGLIIALAFSILINFGMYFFSDKIALAMYRAKPADPSKDRELIAIVRELATMAKMPMPKVYVINTDTPNAFATGRGPKHASVAATSGILSLLSKSELRGVIAHELSHIKNRDILIATIAATLAGVISYLAAMARWAAIFGGIGGGNRDGENILSLIVLAVLTPLLAVIIQLAISRSREYAADAGGAKIIGNGEPLAAALEKLEGANKSHPLRFGSTSGASLFIVNPFSGHAFINLFSTHPPMKERIRRLRGLHPTF